MKIFRVGAVAGAICSFAVIGCASEEGSTVEPQNGAPSVESKVTAPDTASASVASGVPANISKLFSRMDSVGVGSQQKFDEALAEFRGSQDPIGQLAKFYAQLPSSAQGARWKAVYAAAQIPSGESVEFLGRIAGEKPEVDPAVTGDEGGDIGFRMRYTASVGVVQHHAAGIQGAQTAVERLLKDADASIAQLVGVELFSKGLLTDSLREILSKRGISNKFRKLSDAELNKIRAVDPSKDGHVGADTRTRPRWTSVPALSAEE
jgi:hypothetical protein